MRFLLLCTFTVALATASSPQAWEMSTYKDFSAGRMKGLSLGRDGRLELAPRLNRVYATDQPVVWSATRTPDGAIWLGTGHGGRLYRVDASGNGALVFTAPEPEIFALASDAQGRVYAATSPNGRIYRIDPTANGRAIEYFTPPASQPPGSAQYILSMAMDRAGVLYAGTGIDGKVFRVRAQGQGEVWYETGQAHVTALVLDAQGRLLAGTAPNGIIYRINGQGQAFTLYDADLPEIRALHAAADGSVYAAAMGGSIAKQTTFSTPAAGASTPGASTSTSVTVTAAEESAVINPKPTAPAQPATPAAVTSATPVVEYPGVEKAALYRVGADNTVEKLWGSTEENLYDIAPGIAPGSIYLATDNQGRVYEMAANRKLRLIVETRETEALRLLAGTLGVNLVTGHAGALYRIDGVPETTGEFESPVHDGTAISRWGKLSWRGESCNGCRVLLKTRTGNTIRPDATWSDWSAAAVDENASAIGSPNARYVQWKAELAGAGGLTPKLDYVRLTSLPQNGAPKVSSITVSSAQVTATAAAASAGASPTFTLTVTDTGEAGPSSLTGTPSQAVTRAGSESLIISWTAEDPDADKMTYTLEFRADDQREWKALKRDATEATFSMPADALADGRYFLRVTASDAAVNAPADAKTGELTSPPIVVDRTPPVVRIANNQVSAADVTSPLTRCEYSVDAGPWAMLAAVDGIVDSKEELFTMPPIPGTGERLLAVRCYDAANNAGTARLVLH